MTIQKAAVIGAGVMGSGIAAQIANAGIPVVLLDIVPKGAASRNAIAEGAVARLLKSDPAAFMHPRNARLVTTGNLEDELDRLVEYLDHSARHLGQGHADHLSGRLPDHPFLQPAALHAAPRARRRAGDAVGRGERN